MRHTFFCIDGHTAGNPVRLVAGGAPLLKGASMSERRQDFLSRFDWIRTGLCFEPRGHDMMSGGFLYPPSIRRTISASCSSRPAAACRCVAMAPSGSSPSGSNTG
jgi:4-hydroxyproline epimerase